MAKVIILPGEVKVYKFSSEDKKEFAGKSNYAIKLPGKTISGVRTLKELNKRTNYYGINRFNKDSWDK